MYIIIRIALLILGYGFGLIQTAYIYGKAHGIDIREHGSGNAGTTNTLRVLGKKAGLIVFVGDILKTCVPVLVMGFIWIKMCEAGALGLTEADMQYKFLWKLYMGFGAILGHNFPFYMNFKGGKGIAATSGMIIGFHWTFIPLGLITFFGIVAITHYVSLASLVLMAVFFGYVVVTGFLGVAAFSGVASTAIMIEMFIVTFFICGLAYIKHAENIKRLMSHSERKTYIFKKNKEEK